MALEPKKQSSKRLKMSGKGHREDTQSTGCWICHLEVNHGSDPRKNVCENNNNNKKDS